MDFFLDLLFTIAWIYTAVLLFYLTISWVKIFARDWYPQGTTVICIELLFSLIDPPLNALRKVIKPLNMGGVSVDFSVFVLLIIIQLVMLAVSKSSYM